MDTILVLCQSRRQSALIARTLRYRQVYSLPLALDSRAETVLSYAPKGIVLSANDGMDNALAQVDPRCCRRACRCWRWAAWCRRCAAFTGRGFALRLPARRGDAGPGA